MNILKRLFNNAEYIKEKEEDTWRSLSIKDKYLGNKYFFEVGYLGADLTVGQINRLKGFVEIVDVKEPYSREGYNIVTKNYFYLTNDITNDNEPVVVLSTDDMMYERLDSGEGTTWGIDLANLSFTTINDKCSNDIRISIWDGNCPDSYCFHIQWEFFRCKNVEDKDRLYLKNNIRKRYNPLMYESLEIPLRMKINETIKYESHTNRIPVKVTRIK